jgi:thiol-disulfide isomerase/thioredoxin
MKKIITILLFSMVNKLSYSQTINFTVSEFQNLPDTCIIFIGALWCSPCIEKQNVLEDFLKFHKNIPYFVVYDKMKYTKEKRESLIKNQSLNTDYLLDAKYYQSGGVISVVSPKKAIKKFYIDLSSKGYSIIKDEDLWFGNCIIKKKNDIIILKSDKTPAIFVEKILKVYKD